MTQTKKALMMSIFSMVLCMAMLIGTTFAWFTDTASTAVNIVKSGDLKLDIVNNDGSKVGNNNQIKFVNENGNVLWDRGSTFKTEGFKIKNTGKLALKYQLMVNVGEIDKDLRDNMTFTIVNKNGDSVENDKVVTGNLAALEETVDDDGDTVANSGSESDVYYIKGHMDENASNDCQGKKLKDISITVIATQDAVENDSNGKDYDGEAAYPADILKTQLELGGPVKLTGNVAVEPKVSAGADGLVPQMTVNKDTTLDLNGKKLTVDRGSESYGKASPLLIAVTGGMLTINGDGEINCEAGNNQVYGINVNGNNAKVVINGGKFYGALTAVQVQKGLLEINGGFFDMAPTCKDLHPDYAKYVVNAIDANYKDGIAKISIKGGTFVNFDPSANPEGAGTSYVADGYKVVSETKDNGEIWYKVVPNTTN